ncbi:hypothetical protein CJO86_13835 [Ralstonia solanacearum]|nr:hypothetical protein CJO86_13835 [Ralstonia solanacearum]
MPYWKYAEEHPVHNVLSVRDHIRLQWGLLALPDPTMDNGALHRADPSKAKRLSGNLQWLFAGTSVEVIPITFTSLNNRKPTLVTTACGPDDILIRLAANGDPGAYARSLERALKALHEQKRRDRGRKIAVYGTTEYDPILDKTAVYIDPDDEPDVDTPITEVVIGRDHAPLAIKRKTLHFALRMADLFAEFERGELALTRKETGRNKDIDVRIPFGDVRTLCRALVEHHKYPPRTLNTKANTGDFLTFETWLDHAEQLVVYNGYARLARADLTEKADTKKKDDESRNG